MPATTGSPVVIPPTVGRIVLFRKDEVNTFPAIITRVHEGTKANGVAIINLMVFADFVCEAMTSVYHGENVGQWDWMEFQRDQQKRAELMAEKIAEEKLPEIGMPPQGTGQAPQVEAE